MEFLRIIGHGVHELLSWIAPAPSHPPRLSPVASSDSYILQEALHLSGFPRSTQIRNPNPERIQILNFLNGTSPEDLRVLQRARQANSRQSQASFDELVGGSILGCVFFLNPVLAFATTMTGLTFEAIDHATRVPPDQELIFQAQSHLRQWSPTHPQEFPSSFIWEVDAQQNSGPQSRELFDAREVRFNEQVREAHELLRRYPTEDPILQISLLYQHLYENSCIRNYDLYRNRPSRIFDTPREAGQRGCGNCDARAQAQLAFYLASGVQLGNAEHSRYLFANHHYNDHIELVVFDTQTRFIWNPMTSFGNAESVQWQRAPGDVYRIEYWMQAYLEQREQHSPLSWNDLRLVRGDAPASAPGIFDRSRLEASPFRGPPAAQSAGHGRVIPEQDLTPAPVHPSLNENPSATPSSAGNPPAAPDELEQRNSFAFSLLRHQVLSFVFPGAINTPVFSSPVDHEIFEQLSPLERQSFLERHLLEDYERLVQTPELQTFYSLIEHPENMASLLQAEHPQARSLVAYLSQLFSIIANNRGTLNILENFRNASSIPRQFRHANLRWTQWAHENHIYLLQTLSQIPAKDRFHFLNLLNQFVPRLQNGTNPFLAHIRLGTSLHDLTPAQRNRFQVTPTIAAPDLRPSMLMINLQSRVFAFDPRRPIPPPLPAPTPTSPSSSHPLPIPLDLESILYIAQEFGRNDQEINRIWTPQATREMTSLMFTHHELFFQYILPALVRTRFSQMPQAIRNDYLQADDRGDPSILRPVLPYLSPDLQRLIRDYLLHSAHFARISTY